MDPRADLNPSAKFFPLSHLPSKKVVSLDTTEAGIDSKEGGKCQLGIDYPQSVKNPKVFWFRECDSPDAKTWSWEGGC